MLSITNGEFAWSKNFASPTLEDVNLSVRKGELVGILGRVGAGKVRLHLQVVFGRRGLTVGVTQSSLLSAVIGEMVRVEGEVTLSGCISYAPQNPWYVSLSR